MINTIFYFTDSLPYETYQTKIDKDSDDGIASKTIVFAKQQGKIYNNGFSYGITQSEIQQLINASVATSQGKLENDDAVIREALISLSSDLNDAKGRINTAELAITTLQNTLSTTQGNLSNYVTLDTDQELTGDKLFRGANLFTFNKLSSDEVLIQSGINSINVKQSRITSQQITTPKIVVTGQPSDNVLLAGGSSLNLSDQGYANGSAVQDGFDDVNGRIDDLSDAVDDKLSLSTGGTVTGDITANSFIKSGSSDNYVLLGGGGHKPLSEIVSVNPGTTVVHEDYDDTELRGLIANLDDAIDSVSATADDTAGDLSDLLTNLDNSIKTKVESLLDDATWVQNNFPEGTTGSASNFGQSDVESYLQTIGVWELNEAHTASTTKWSELSQSVDGIASRVTLLEGATATGGNVNYSLLSSSLYAYIHDHYADSGVESTWGKFGLLTTGDILMIQWMSSGMNAQASDSTSVANLFAAAKDYQTNLSAIADVKSLVERDLNDDLKATTYMTAMVDQAIGGIRSDVGGNYASTTVFNKIDDNETVLAALVTKVTGDSSSSTMLSKVLNMSSGVATTADITSATASMLTTSDISNLSSALNVAVDSKINTAKATLVAASDYNAASIVAMVNASNDSSIKLSADKITLDGQTVAGSIAAENITLTGHVSANDFQAGPSNQLNIKTSGSRISFCDGSTEKAWFVLDGSGLQLHIIDNTGTERVIDWQYWDSATPTYRPLSYYYKSSENNPSTAFSPAQLYVKLGLYYKYNSSTGNYDAVTSETFYTKDVLSVLPEIAETDFDNPSLYRMSESSGVYGNYGMDYIEPCNSQTPLEAGLNGYLGKVLYDRGLRVDPSYIDVYTEYTITSNSITATGYTVSIARQLPAVTSKSNTSVNMSSSEISFVVPGPAAIAQLCSPSVDYTRTVRTPINTVSSVTSARTTSSFVAEEGDNNGTYIDIDGNSQTAS